MDYVIRKARPDERDAIEGLIAESARSLSRGDYTDEQIEAAVAHVYGVDSELVRDGTYFVAEADGKLIGCGGWSRRRTLFGGDRFAAREPGALDPSTEPAKIRAFFVHPAWARRGVGRAILKTCEREAREHGFSALELMATLPGVKLYAAHGYEPGEPVTHDAGGVPLEFVPMRKELKVVNGK